MDDNGKSARIMCKLADKHLESVVSLTVWWKDRCKEGREPINSFGTGSIIHSSEKFMLILTCSHTFQSFITCSGPGFDSVGILNENLILQLDFFDGHSAKGVVYCIDWWQDLCLVLIPFPNKSYEPVKFIEDENLMGQSVYKRGAEVFSIFCLPTHQKDRKLLFGTTSDGEISGCPIIGNDLGPMYHPNLEFFEFAMLGARGASGAPVFTKNLLVMGIWICRCDGMQFALKIDQIRRWVLDCFFDIDRTKSMTETIARLSALVSACFD